MTTKIDWPNHIIAFFSALLGILIAFQLEDYRENRQDDEKLENTVNAIQNEIDNNLRIYRNNVDKIGNWLEYWELLSSVDGDGMLEVKKYKFERLKAKTPHRFEGWILIKQMSDSVLVLQTTGDIDVDVLPETGISVSSWTAGLYSGILNRFDHNRLIKLTHIYEWIEKDLGVSDREIIEDQIDSDIDDIDIIIAHFTRIVRVHKLKHQRIKTIYDKIEWE